METLALQEPDGFAVVTSAGIIGCRKEVLFFSDFETWSGPSPGIKTVDDAFKCCGASVKTIPISDIDAICRIDAGVVPYCDPPRGSVSLSTPEDAEVAIDLLHKVKPDQWDREECKSEFWPTYIFPTLGAIFVSCMSILAFKYSLGADVNVIGRNRRRAEGLAAVAQAIGPVGVTFVTLAAAVGIGFWYWKAHQMFRPYYTRLDRHVS